MKGIAEIEELEIKTGVLVHRLIEYKQSYQDILSKYDVRNHEKIKEKIASGSIEGHPAYEDYLDAVAYLQEIEELERELDQKVKTLKNL